MKKTAKDGSASSAVGEAGGAARTRQALSGHRDRVVSDVQIRARAYEIYLERGDRPGDELSDWLQAEREYQRGV